MSQWAVWEDPNDGCVYASWTLRPRSLVSQTRIWELNAKGAAVEVSGAVLPVQPPGCVIERLADLSEPATLANSAIVQLDGLLYARAGRDVYAHDKKTGDWLACSTPPPELVKLRGGGLAIRDD